MSRKNIQMVDLKAQYESIKSEVDKSISAVLESSSFIQGPFVQEFEKALAEYMGVKHVIGCANGTDALQIACMALGISEGDEVIVPAFTYVATAEVLGVVKATPVMVDVNPNTFTIDINALQAAITPRTKAIVPVHLYGQSAKMDELMAIAREHNLFVIEDTAQAIGADYQSIQGHRKVGTIGDIGCTSFFPSKNLGCYGDGGAIFTNNDELAAEIRMIANHGQRVKYQHDVIGLNSRLDAIQAAILNVKLKRLNQYSSARLAVAEYYDYHLKEIQHIEVPIREEKSTHVFHQYTLKVTNGKRDELKAFLQDRGIPSMIYYPIPLHEQLAFKNITRQAGELNVSTELCSQVLSLPIHTEFKREDLEFIVSSIKDFFNE